jgi:hypothetical protein
MRIKQTLGQKRKKPEVSLVPQTQDVHEGWDRIAPLRPSPVRRPTKQARIGASQEIEGSYFNVMGRQRRSPLIRQIKEAQKLKQEEASGIHLWACRRPQGCQSLPISKISTDEKSFLNEGECQKSCLTKPYLWACDRTQGCQYRPVSKISKYQQSYEKGEDCKTTCSSIVPSLARWLPAFGVPQIAATQKLASGQVVPTGRIPDYLVKTPLYDLSATQIQRIKRLTADYLSGAPFHVIHSKAIKEELPLVPIFAPFISWLPNTLVTQTLFRDAPDVLEYILNQEKEKDTMDKQE